MFYFSANRLHHDMTTVPASLTAVKLRMAANMGADGTGWDAHGQGNFCAGLSQLEHLMDGFDILFFSWAIPPLNLRFCAWHPVPVVRPIAVGIHMGLGVYSPGNLCEFVRAPLCRCPQGKAPKMHWALPPWDKKDRTDRLACQQNGIGQIHLGGASTDTQYRLRGFGRDIAVLAQAV